MASLERNAAPLAAASSRVVCKGSVALDKHFLCEVAVRSMRATRSVTVARLMIDTGAQTSVISQAALLTLQQQGAVCDDDIVTLDKPRYVKSWDQKGPMRAVSEMVLLHVTAVTTSTGGDPVSFGHPFLVLPHLTKDMIVGRDLLNKHGYNMSSTADGSLLQLGVTTTTDDKLAQLADTVELLEPLDYCSWQLVLTEPL